MERVLEIVVSVTANRDAGTLRSLGETLFRCLIRVSIVSQVRSHRADMDARLEATLTVTHVARPLGNHTTMALVRSLPPARLLPLLPRVPHLPLSRGTADIVSPPVPSPQMGSLRLIGADETSRIAFPSMADTTEEMVIVSSQTLGGGSRHTSVVISPPRSQPP